MIERRSLLKSLGAAALSWPAAWSVLARAEGRSRQVFVDAMTHLSPAYSGRLLDDIVDGGLRACVVTVGAPAVLGNAGLRRVIGELHDFTEYIDAHRGSLLVGRTADDIERAVESDRIAVFFEVENASVVSDDLDRLDQLHRMGVRVLQLTFNTRNDVGDGYLEATNAGLSRFGMDVVERMNELGMLVDLSHCGEATATGALAVSSRPPAITHAACRAVFESQRNKSDDLLRSLADKGGVVGILQAREFLGDGDGMELYLRHIDHAINAAGIEHVGVGSDREYRAVPDTAEERRRLGERLARDRSDDDEVPPPIPWPYFVPALDGPKPLGRLADTLEARGRSAADIDKLLGGNFRRLLRDALG